MKPQATDSISRSFVPHRWKAGLALLASILVVLATAGLAQEEKRTVRAYGEVNNAPQLVIDGSMLEEGAEWDSAGCVWWTNKEAYLVVDLGRPYQIDGLLLQVDNNDIYRVDGSMDGRSWKPLLTIDSDAGEIPSGMDTMSTDSSSPEYVAELKFKPVTARYLKVLVVEGDDAYAISELQVHGEPVAQDAPEGATRVKGNGKYNHRAELMVDGDFAEDGSEWDGEKSVWWQDTAVSFVIDLGQVQRIANVTVQVDNNDDYRLEASVDGKTFAPLLTIPSDLGEVATGLDTFSTDKESAAYVAQLKFKPQRARYVRVLATDGDGMYAVAEVQLR